MKSYENSLIAWEGLNESFLRNDEWIHGSFRGANLYAYNMTIFILKPKLDPDFDFGRHFNYTDRKWTMLVNNYVNKQELANVKKMLDEQENSKSHKSRYYNIAYQFDSSHSNSKNCLLTMILSRREPRALIPIRNMTVILRASEVTKRLVVDLLLFQRIGEYLWGDKEWTLTIHFNQIFNDDNVLLMYHAHKNIKNILKVPGVALDRQTSILHKLRKLSRSTIEEQPYKIYKRVITVLRDDLYKYPKTLAKDCKLFTAKDKIYER